MARRPAGSDPAYRHHKPTNRAVVSLPMHDGTTKDVYLGEYNSPESKREYARVIAEWKVALAQAAESGPSVAEICAPFLDWAQTYYTKAGARTSEYDNFRHALRPVLYLYGETPATRFGPNALRAVRQLMIDGYDHPTRGRQDALARTVINSRIRRVRQVFKWAVGREMLPASVYQALATVEPLEAGRSMAREAEKVGPVPVAVVEATLPHLPAPVAAMVQIQLLTGMRPGEVVLMRADDIDRTGDLWVYVPSRHKTEHHGRPRVVVLGPRAQELLVPWLAKAAADGLPLFSPAREAEERYARLRAKRKTPVQPSQKSRRKAKAKRKPRDAYDSNSYAGCVRRACKANAIASWHPHQLRHNHAEAVRKLFGLDHVQAALGHATRAMSERYAELDLSFASDVAKEIG